MAKQQSKAKKNTIKIPPYRRALPAAVNDNVDKLLALPTLISKDPSSVLLQKTEMEVCDGIPQAEHIREQETQSTVIDLADIESSGEELDFTGMYNDSYESNGVEVEAWQSDGKRSLGE